MSNLVDQLSAERKAFLRDILGTKRIEIVENGEVTKVPRKIVKVKRKNNNPN
jgi:hypothetical protein